jgi:hypothetical protein
MRKIFILLLLVTILGTIFSGVIRTSVSSNSTDATVLFEHITPVIAYADSDTLDVPGNIPPPPPPIN